MCILKVTHYFPPDPVNLILHAYKKYITYIVTNIGICPDWEKCPFFCFQRVFLLFKISRIFLNIPKIPKSKVKEKNLRWSFCQQQISNGFWGKLLMTSSSDENNKKLVQWHCKRWKWKISKTIGATQIPISFQRQSIYNKKSIYVYRKKTILYRLKTFVFLYSW